MLKICLGRNSAANAPTYFE